MKYGDARAHIRTGDIIACHYTGGIWSLIRLITGSTVSHVGIAIRLGHGLYVAEMQRGGNVLRPISQITAAFSVYPCPTNKLKKTAILAALRHRIDYAYEALPLIALGHLASIFVSRNNNQRYTCGTFCAEILRPAGWYRNKLPKNPSPAQLVAVLDEPKFTVQPRNHHER